MNKLVVIGLAIILIVAVGYFVKSRFQTVHTVTKNTGKLQVTASFYPLYFFSSEISKDRADVKNITPAGAEPHDYEPTTQDIARIEHSNMLVLNGGLEAWGDKIKENLKGKNVLIVIAGEGLETQQITEDGKTATDPHIWLDPTLAKKEVERIQSGYNKIDAKNVAYYDLNKKSLEEKLDALDEKYKKGLANCKEKNIITSHAAFGYLASRYGLKQVPISGLSPDAEPSTQQLAEVADFAKKNNVKYIFFESLVSPKLAETIAREVGAKTLVLDPLEGLSEDDIRAGKNYFTLMEENLKNLQLALDCSK